MELTGWILITLIIFTILFFVFFTLYQRKIDKIKKNKVVDLKKHQSKLNKRRKRELSKAIQEIITETLSIVDNFDPLKSKITLIEIKNSTINKINELEEMHSYKELLAQEPDWINNLFINKLKKENPANWRKKYANELEKEMKLI